MAIIATAPNSLNQHLQTGNHCPVGDAHPAVPIRPADESARISTAARGLDRGWDWWAALSVDACFVNRVGSLTEVPRRCWGDFNRCAIVALERLERDPLDLHAWKLHSLLPRLLLAPIPEGDGGVTQVVRDRCNKFLNGEWESLI